MFHGNGNQLMEADYWMSSLAFYAIISRRFSLLQTTMMHLTMWHPYYNVNSELTWTRFLNIIWKCAFEPFYKPRGGKSDFRQLYAPLHAIPQHLPPSSSPLNFPSAFNSIPQSLQYKHIRQASQPVLVHSGKWEDANCYPVFNPSSLSLPLPPCFHLSAVGHGFFYCLVFWKLYLIIMLFPETWRKTSYTSDLHMDKHVQYAAYNHMYIYQVARFASQPTTTQTKLSWKDCHDGAKRDRWNFRQNVFSSVKFM